MPSIGPGCHELRIRDAGVTWRIIYFIAQDAIVVLEVFDKKTPATPAGVVQNCKRRLRSYKTDGATK